MINAEALFFQIFKMLGYSPFVHAFKKVSSEHELWFMCDSFVEKRLLIVLVYNTFEKYESIRDFLS